jgi:hypothetical protein
VSLRSDQRKRDHSGESAANLFHLNESFIDFEADGIIQI